MNDKRNMSILERIRRKVRGSSVFASLLVSVLFIMLVPIAANLTVVVSSQRALQKQIDTTYRDRFDTIVRKTEEIYASAYNQVLRLASAGLVTDYLKQPARDYYAEYEIRLHLESVLGADSSLAMCYLYMPQYDYVIYSGAGLPSHYFSARMYEMGYEEWKGALRLNTDSIVVKNWHASEAGAFTRSNVLKSIAYSTSDGDPAVVGVEISSKQLVEEMRRMGFDEGSGITLLSTNGVLASTLPMEESALLYGRYIGGGLLGGDTIQAGNTAYYTDIHELKRYGITAVYTIANSIMGEETRFFRYSVIYALIFGTMLTILLGVIFSQSHARRVKRILAILNEQSPEDVPPEGAVQRRDGSNEYEAIEALVNHTIKRYSVLTEVVGTHSDELMASFFQKVLAGQEKERSVIKETFRLYGYRFNEGAYTVLTCQLIAAKRNGRDAEPLATVCRALAALDLSDHGVSAQYWTVYDGAVVGLLSFDIDRKNLELSRMAEQCAKAAEEAAAIVPEYTPLAVASPVMDDLARIAMAYAICQEKLALEEQREVDDASQEDWIAAVNRIIALQYADQGLSTSSIADQLSLTRPYLSQHYKNATGIGLHEALQRYRIDRAKEIILQQDENLQEVAQWTGFASVESLIRNFKKYVGTTPGRFREEGGETAAE